MMGGVKGCGSGGGGCNDDDGDKAQKCILVIVFLVVPFSLA